MKKQMLNEGEIRKMMRFANIQALTENFLTDKLEEEDEVDEQDDDIQEEGTISEMPLDDEEETSDELPLGDEEPPEEMEPEMEPEMAPEEPVAAGNEALAMELASEIAQALERVLDVNVEAVSDAGVGVPEDEVPLDLEEPALDSEEDVLAPEEEDPDAPGNREMYEEDLVNEITRRVAKRLLRLNKK